MDSNRLGRRRFLKHPGARWPAAPAGVAAGAEWSARDQSAESRGQSAESEAKDHPNFGHGEPSRFVKSGRGARMSIDHITYYTPLQDYAGIITPAGLHFVQEHASHLPDIDPEQHRLTIHGMVDRPMSFTLEELKRLPSVTRIHFLECNANSAPSGPTGAFRTAPNATAQDTHGFTSCSVWTGAPLSILLKKAGVQAGATWIVGEGSEKGKHTKSIPIEKAMDDVLVAYGQNGEALRPE